MRCSVVQCVVVGCSVCVVGDIAEECVYVCCSVLQCVTMYCGEFCCNTKKHSATEHVLGLQCVAMRCSALRWVTVCVCQET